MPRVLIAGAGPAGLCAASVLAEAGIPVTVLEAEPRLPENLRASTFQPPTLDLLARFGADRRLIEMGRIAPRVQYRDRAGWVAEFDFGVLAGQTAHPYRVQCEQFRLNQVLAARLPEVRYGSPVDGVVQDESSVTVTLGSGETLQGDWLIGADGARSRVREALGIRLEGFTWPERFLVASTPFDFAQRVPQPERRELLRRSRAVVLPAAGARIMARHVSDACRGIGNRDPVGRGHSGAPAAHPFRKVRHPAPHPVCGSPAGGGVLPEGTRIPRRRCCAPQQSAWRHGHERRHPRRFQSGRSAGSRDRAENGRRKISMRTSASAGRSRSSTSTPSAPPTSVIWRRAIRRNSAAGGRS